MNKIKNSNQGFTLIELLVVVLIIGILTAIALPQYKFAVRKSKFATLKDLTGSLAKAEEIYFLANGSYTPDIDNLDISFPEIPTSIDSSTHYKTYHFKWGFCQIVDERFTDTEARVLCRYDSINLQYGFYLTQVPSNATARAKRIAGKRRCRPLNSDKLSQKICEQETGSTTTDNGDYLY